METTSRHTAHSPTTVSWDAPDRTSQPVASPEVAFDRALAALAAAGIRFEVVDEDAVWRAA